MRRASCDGLDLVVDQQVDAPARASVSAGPTSSGATTPRPPPSIIAGPPMPMLALRVEITESQLPSSAALPAKQ